MDQRTGTEQPLLTGRQAEIVEAVDAYGQAGAARMLGVSISRVQTVWAKTHRPAPRTCRACGRARRPGHLFEEAHAEAVFWPRVDRDAQDGHWLWRGEMIGGYPVVGREADEDGRTHVVMAHIYAWTLEHGRLPGPDMEIDHVCRERRCVRAPQDENGHWHLEEVTHRVNGLRSDNPAGRNWRKTQCVNGHPLPPPKHGFWRVCVECRRKRRRDYNRRVADAKRLSEGQGAAVGLDANGADPAGGPADPAAGVRGAGGDGAGSVRRRRGTGTVADW